MLVADGLPVDDEADLRVIAQRMEEAVAVGSHAAGAIHDGLAQAGAGIDVGEFHDQVPVGIGVRGRIDFDHIRSAASTVTVVFGSGQRQRGFELHGHGAANGHILAENGEPRSRDLQVIGIRRDVAQAEGAIGAGGGGLL